MTAYYNELDPYCCQWLRNLINAGLIPAGDVDERPIEEVSTDDLKGYTQCHFFAGIAGWAYATRLAGWPDDRPIWTGSCPCQPFSSAGKRLAERDPRNLWPDFARLISDCRPPVVAGEQVASKAGRLWLAGVRADLEALGYGVGAADLCAAGVGAPHVRQRLWWVADSERAQSPRQQPDGWPVVSVEETKGPGLCGDGSCGMGDAGGKGLPERECDRRVQSEAMVAYPWQTPECSGDAYWVECADGKARRIEPGIEPLAHGVPARVGKLRAYGNAIVPQVAAEFLMAYMDTLSG